MHTTLTSLVLSLAAAGVSAENPPYLGCIASPPEGLGHPMALNAINFQKGIKGTPKLCAEACQNGNKPDYLGFDNDYPLSALDGYSCFCGFQLSPNVTTVPDSVCTRKCPGDDSSTCGGDKAYTYSLYGDEQFLSPPHYMAGLTFGGCYDFDEAKYRGPKYTDASKMTVNSCASFCVRKHGKTGVTLDKDNNCYCTDAEQDMGRVNGDSEWSCNHPCPGDKRQSCGGGKGRHTTVSHWKFKPQ